MAYQPHIHQTFDIANESGLSDEELEAQHRRFDFIWLQKNSIQKALDDGKEIGQKIGEEIGEKKVKNLAGKRLLLL